MSLFRVVCLTVTMSLPAAHATGQSMPAPGNPVPPTPEPRGSQMGVCTIQGQVMAPGEYGVPAGQPVADVTAIRLPDGRVRLYAFAQDVGVVSALSVSSDGLTFVPEAGARLPNGSGMPRIVAMPAGGVRMFFTAGGGIKSATSTNGLTFTEEPGIRITAQALGFADSTAAAASGATVIRLADGRYRMYVSDLPRPGDQPGGHWIKSAISTDMLTWAVEEGVRMGAGAPVLTDSAEHPFALANADGTMTLYYGKFPGPGSVKAEGLYRSTSADGLTFEREELAVFFGNDPDAIRLTDGTLALYFGSFDTTIGGTVNVATCPDPSAPIAGSQGSRR